MKKWALPINQPGAHHLKNTEHYRQNWGFNQQTWELNGNIAKNFGFLADTLASVQIMGNHWHWRGTCGEHVNLCRAWISLNSHEAFEQFSIWMLLKSIWYRQTVQLTSRLCKRSVICMLCVFPNVQHCAMWDLDGYVWSWVCFFRMIQND
jgi:hypothetical protein